VATTSPDLTDLSARLRLAIVRTARRMRQEALRGEGSAELSPTLAAALATIDAHGPLTPSELAERERIRRPTATRVVARLIESGLVDRAADPGDRRSALVSTTAEGTALLRRLRKRKTAYLARRLVDLEPDELVALERAADVLERLLEERDEA
jgi:DNA-binding MarR family transcriptional regulator